MKYSFGFILPLCISCSGISSVHANENSELESKDSQQYSPHHVVKTLSFQTDYIFRGMSYARRRGAASFYVDYNHDNGLYLGTGIINLDKGSVYGNTMEIDVYGGIAGQITEDLRGSIGLFQWIFPQNKKVAGNSAFVTELHAVLEYKPFTLKYAYSFTDWFGINTKSYGNQQFGNRVTGEGDTKGTDYISLDYNKILPYYDLNFNFHIGRTKVKNYSIGDYTDMAIGLSKDFLINNKHQWSAGVSYITTDGNSDWYVDADGYKMGNSKIFAFLRHTF